MSWIDVHWWVKLSMNKIELIFLPKLVLPFTQCMGIALMPSHLGQSYFTFLSPFHSLDSWTSGFYPSSCSSPPTSLHPSVAFPRPPSPFPRIMATISWGVSAPSSLSFNHFFFFSHYHHSYLLKIPAYSCHFLALKTLHSCLTDIRIHFKLPGMAYKVLPDLAQNYLNSISCHAPPLGQCYSLCLEDASVLPLPT